MLLYIFRSGCASCYIMVYLKRTGAKAGGGSHLDVCSLLLHKAPFICRMEHTGKGQIP